MRVICFLFIVFFPSIVRSQSIITVAGNGYMGDTGDGGAATNATLNVPYGGVFDNKGNYYFVEASANRARRVSSSGVISTIAGDGTAGFFGDGHPATNSKINSPFWITSDIHGNLYVADFGNHRIRKIDTFGIINTVAGDGGITFGGDGSYATNASLVAPSGVCVDDTGNIYICDETRIREINTSGVINTIVGNGVLGFSGDGGLADTSKIHAHQVYVDTFGNLFILDFDRIRKVDALTHIIHTIAGTGGGVYNGDEIRADSANITPVGLAWDTLGNIFTTDQGNNRVRKIDTAGIIHTVAGNGIASYGGDRGPATAAEMYDPNGLAFDPCWNLYITVKQDFRVRKVIFDTACGQEPLALNSANSKFDFYVYPNPSHEEIIINGANNIAEVSVWNVMGQEVTAPRPPGNSGQVSSKDRVTMRVNISYLPSGVYVLRVVDEDGSVSVRKVIKE